MNYTLTDQSVTVLGDDFVPKTIPASHPAFGQVVSALKAGNDNEVSRLMDLPNAIVTFMQGKIQIADRTLFYDGRPLTNSLTTRILQFMEEGQPELAKPLINFLEKVRENPSRRAAEGLYDWCVRSNLPITPEGDILAWKIVRPDYKDVHSNSFDNSVGQTVEVPRNEVDEDPDRTCSYGLHFCSTHYLPHFGGAGGTSNHVMVVKLHPKDVVAFPRDYNTSKGRACRYEVIGEVPPEKAKDFFPNLVANPDRYFGDSTGSVDDTVEPIVGEYFETRDGRVIQIIEHDEDDERYPFQGVLDGGGAYWFTAEGQFYFGSDEEHPLDLVEHLVDYDPAESEQAAEQPKSLLGMLIDTFFGPK